MLDADTKKVLHSLLSTPTAQYVDCPSTIQRRLQMALRLPIPGRLPCGERILQSSMWSYSIPIKVSMQVRTNATTLETSLANLFDAASGWMLSMTLAASRTFISTRGGMQTAMSIDGRQETVKPSSSVVPTGSTYSIPFALDITLATDLLKQQLVAAMETYAA